MTAAVAAMAESAARSSDLVVRSVDAIGADYVPTLQAWRRNLCVQEDEVRRLGLDERFSRMWDFYLSFCEAGFAERRIDDVHMLLERPAR